MKKIVRLTESDLARIVRRVIKEEGQTFSVLSLKDNLGTVSVMDSRGNNIFDRIDLNEPNMLIADTKRGLNLEEEEDITTIWELDPDWVLTGKYTVTTNYQGLLDGQMVQIEGNKVIITCPTPSQEMLKTVQFTPGCDLQVSNAPKGILKLRTMFNSSTVLPKPTNESYRGRYYRY